MPLVADFLYTPGDHVYPLGDLKVAGIKANVVERVLITGGSGFLGQAIGHRLRNAGHEVLLAARSQTPLIEAGERTRCAVKPLDLADPTSVMDTFDAFRPAVVIHAGASKHVGLAEMEPLECIDVNVHGSQAVARAAIRHGCRVVLGISTDKAAAPAMTTYGISKALMERCFASLDGTAGVRFSLVRLGNLAWSPGSVFPAWREMQRRGETIRTTGPEMRRFFMSVSAAVDIIERQITEIDYLSGKIFVPKLKVAQISDVLDVWTTRFGGAWEPVARRKGDFDDQWMFGPSEGPYATEFALGGHDGIALDLARTRPGAGVEPLSSATAPRLTVEEIDELLAGAQKET